MVIVDRSILCNGGAANICTWKALHNYGDILTRINDRAYLERCSTLSLTSRQSGAVMYAFDRIITEIEENEK